ncbi:hypothetical protein P168DRAFT_277527 [Aspergillus campestris IBT 28561]|uniref:Uncharacterized protein n=1 Tax=Aspergillus campestris (strain IBT 28561) TaxID=1392248 RepID=A0A2I1DDD6_ASPC2|nr:uncharacterized protein P168DRAFT_277527 [Aspergillus campestris IBT 28561]PKY07875.1 hypothetical protein P168DRAFT_277527 [Aspergillus campestris IBT 28561]
MHVLRLYRVLHTNNTNGYRNISTLLYLAWVLYTPTEPPTDSKIGHLRASGFSQLRSTVVDRIMKQTYRCCVASEMMMRGKRLLTWPLIIFSPHRGGVLDLSEIQLSHILLTITAVPLVLLAGPTSISNDNDDPQAHWKCENGWKVCGKCNGGDCKIGGFDFHCDIGKCTVPSGGGDGKLCGIGSAVIWNGQGLSTTPSSRNQVVIRT